MTRRIVGIQTHHHVQLDDAFRSAANACAGLRGAHTLTQSPVIAALADEQQVLCRRISEAHREAYERFQAFYRSDPEAFKRCRDGAAPWPDETSEGFVPRCTCNDACPIHDRGWAVGNCSCDDACPAHTDEPT